MAARCDSVKPERGGFRFAPCPACGQGSKDTAWARAGRLGVVAGCNSGCSFEALARALFPSYDRPPPPPRPEWAKARRTPPPGRREGSQPRKTAPQRPVKPSGTPARGHRDAREGPESAEIDGNRAESAGSRPQNGAVRRPADPPRGRGRVDFAGFAEDLDGDGGLCDGARRWIEGRGLDPGRLAAVGWRSMSGRAAVKLARRHRVKLPRAVARSALLALLPVHDRDGRPASYRARSLDPPGPALTLPGDRGALYGLAAYGAPPGEVLHVAEGETDTEALIHAGAAVAVGLPGAGALHDALVALARDVSPALVALWMDGDKPGRKAAEALGAELAAAGLRVRPWHFPPGMDCGDAWRTDPQALAEAVARMSAGVV